MDEFVRGFETRLFSGELPRYKPILEEAKLVMTNQEMSSNDKFARQIAAVKAALARLQDIVGGSRFPGKAVDSKGNLINVETTRAGRLSAVRVEPPRTGTYYASVTVHNSPEERTGWALVYAYK